VAQGEVAPDRHPPEFVLPFTVTKARAQRKFDDWLAKGGWFVPGDLKTAGMLESLRGVYVPFWSFSMRSESTWSARIGEWYWTTETYTTVVNGKTVVRTRRVRHTEWYPLSGRYHEYHHHYLVSGSRGLPQPIADAIEPFPVAESVRYAPRFLVGWLCEEYSVERDEAAKTSARVFEERTLAGIAAFLPGDEHDSLSADTSFGDVTEDLILLPLWILAYKYRGKTRRFVANGATGTTYGEKPVSATRIGLLVGALIAAGAVLWFLLSR
jgi:hypothetical protein